MNQSKKVEAADNYIRRKKKNLNFFKNHLPSIFKRLDGLILEHAELVVRTEDSDVDLMVNGESWYQGQAKAQADREVSELLQKYTKGHHLNTFSPRFKDSVTHPGFSGDMLRKCLNETPVLGKKFRGYIMPDFIPLLVFMGVGLGFHIHEVVKRKKITNIVIYESDVEIFSSSLFTVDWQEIVSKFKDNGGERLTILIGQKQDLSCDFDLLESELNKYAPFHPYLTVFMNHRGLSENREVCDKLKSELPSFFANLSHYDDEVRRLNYAIHNANNDLEYVVNNIGGTACVKPVAIVGSGPSIDDRAPSIRAVRDKLVLVSCGTGLRALLGLGLTPDFHVELDPDYNTYQLLDGIGREKLKGVTFIAPIDINPLAPGLFEKTLFYLRSDHGLSRLFAAEHRGFSHCSPTCTNTGISIFVGLGFKNVFLFGTDYGFRDRERHHATGSIFGSPDKSEVSDRLEKFAQRTFLEGGLLVEQAVDGGVIYTKPHFFASKRQVENFVVEKQKSSKDLNVYNCSDGAVIAGTKWVSVSQFNELIEDVALKTVETGNTDLLSESSLTLSAANAKQSVNGLVKEVTGRCERWRRMLTENRLEGLYDLSRIVSKVGLSIHTIEANKGFTEISGVQLQSQSLLWASMVHFLSAGLLHAFAFEGEASERTAYMKHWREVVEEFLAELPEHLRSIIVSGASVESDPLVRRSLYAMYDEFE